MTSTSRFSLNRRHFLAGATAAGALSAFNGPTLAADGVPVATGFGWIGNVEHACYWRALDAGYFAEEGVDASYVAGGPGLPNPLVSLSADQLQVANADWVPVATATSKGNDFVVLGAGFPRSPSAFLSLTGNPIREPADLVGKRLLMQSQSNTTIVDAILSNAGLPLEYEMVPTGFSPEPLLAGDGDAFLCFATNQPITLEQMGMQEGDDFVVTLLDDLGYRIPAAMMTVQRQLITDHRDAMVGYMRALARGYADNAADPSVAAQLVIDKYGVDYGLDLNQQQRQSELQVPLMKNSDKGPFYFDVASVSEALTQAAVAGGADPAPDLDAIIDLSLLEEALSSL